MLNPEPPCDNKKPGSGIAVLWIDLTQLPGEDVGHLEEFYFHTQVIIIQTSIIFKIICLIWNSGVPRHPLLSYDLVTELTSGLHS